MASSVSENQKSLSSVPVAPKSAFWGIDNLLDLQRDILGFFEKLAPYGDLVHRPLGPIDFYAIFHPDLIHQVLVEDADKYHKAKRQKRVIGQVIGDSTLNSDGDFWRQQRKLVQPSFHAKRVQAYAELMVEATHQAINSWKVGTEINLLQEMMNVTMTIIAQTMFGADVSNHETNISRYLSVCLETEMKQMEALIIPPAWLPSPNNRRFHEAIRFFDKLINGFIRQRRAAKIDSGDLLSMLLLATDEDSGLGLTDQQVRDEALTIFSAGHETTANLLTWTWIELMNHPDIEAKLHEEVKQVLEDRPPTLVDLHQMPYTEMVLKEALRFHPPITLIAREPIKDVSLSEYRIPKGSLVEICTHVVHRDKRFWEDPLTFRPERFANNAEKHLPRYAYLPFGGGPRICTGQALAMLEAQIILLMMVQRRMFKLRPGQNLTPHISIVQRPGMAVYATVMARA